MMSKTLKIGKLTVIVTYYTRYTSVDKHPILLSFGLGNEVAVNSIIGKLTVKEWKGCVDFNNNIFTSEKLMLQFDMEYKVADTGLPKNGIFDSTGFIRPYTTFSAGAHIVSIDRGKILQPRKPKRMLWLQLLLIHMWMVVSLDPSLHPKIYD